MGSAGLEQALAEQTARAERAEVQVDRLRAAAQSIVEPAQSVVLEANNLGGIDERELHSRTLRLSKALARWRSVAGTHNAPTTADAPAGESTAGRPAATTAAPAEDAALGDDRQVRSELAELRDHLSLPDSATAADVVTRAKLVAEWPSCFDLISAGSRYELVKRAVPDWDGPVPPLCDSPCPGCGTEGEARCPHGRVVSSWCAACPEPAPAGRRRPDAAGDVPGALADTCVHGRPVEHPCGSCQAEGTTQARDRIMLTAEWRTLIHNVHRIDSDRNPSGDTWYWRCGVAELTTEHCRYDQQTDSYAAMLDESLHHLERYHGIVRPAGPRVGADAAAELEPVLREEGLTASADAMRARAADGQLPAGERSAAVQVWPDSIDDKPGLRYRTPTGGGFCTDGWACLADHASVRAVLGRHAVPADDTAAPVPRRRRLRACVEAWPEADDGGYDPRCCRFPKSCSASAYDPDRVAEDALEPLAGQPVRDSQDATPTSGEEPTDA